jgi:Tol biopolymer transport system component
VTVFDSVSNDYTHRWPWFLPDGQHFLYFARTEGSDGGEKDAICLGSLEGGIAERLIPTKSDVAFANGHLLYMLNGTLMAHPFNPASRELTGDAVPLAENGSMNQRFSRAIFTVSQTGILVYQTGTVLTGSQLTLFDREGRVIDTVGDRNTMYVPRFSPDESRIATDITDPVTGNVDIWIYELRRGIRTRLTFDSVMSIAPVWSPDGNRVAFTSDRDNKWGIYTKDVSGARPAELLLEIPEDTYAIDWSPDGRYISYIVPDSSGIDDIGILELGKDSVVRRFTETVFDEDTPRFSQDGRWLAYVSNESGDREVYVVPFPNPTGKWQISLTGGGFPCWSADGKEIYYLDNSDRIVVADVDGSGTSFKIGEVRPLFEARGYRTGLVYDATDDGERFVVNLLEGASGRKTLSLVVNWPEELKEQ